MRRITAFLVVLMIAVLCFTCACGTTEKEPAIGSGEEIVVPSPPIIDDPTTSQEPTTSPPNEEEPTEPTEPSNPDESDDPTVPTPQEPDTPIEPEPEPEPTPTPIDPVPEPEPEPTPIDPEPNPNPAPDQVPEPEPEPEPEPIVPKQNELLTPLTDTMWKDEYKRFVFNDDGSVYIIGLCLDGAIAETAAEFKWKYSDGLLYMFDSDTEELVRIESEPVEKIVSEKFGYTLVRTDAVVKSAVIITERNIYKQVKIIFENGAFICNEFNAYSDETATTPATAETENIYLYPSDLHEMHIVFAESEFENIVLHNYLGDGYIRSANIVLPTYDDERFLGWSINGERYSSVNDIMFDYGDEEEIIMTADWQPEEVPPEPPAPSDPIVGSYTFSSRKGEFTIIIGNDNTFVIMQDGVKAYEYIWSYMDADKYYILKDVKGEALAQSNKMSLDDNGDLLLDVTEVKSLLGMTMKNYTATKTDSVSESSPSENE